MSHTEIIEQLENTIGLIKQDGKDWLDDRDIPILEVCIKALTALDKIRDEIIEEKDYAYADFEQYKVDYLGVDAEYVEDELPQDDFRYGMERALEIIDKYKAESEG